MPKRTEPSWTASDAPSADRSQSLSRWNTAAGAVLIVAAVLIAYCPALWGGFVLDDDKLVTDNSLIRAPDGLYRFWFTTDAQDYWPMTNSSFWLEWRLWGMRATGYHVTNLMLHAAAALLVWKILRTLGVTGAFLAAFLFAVHPVNVQSVVWISQRKNALAMVFFLLSVLWYLKEEVGKSRRGEKEFQNRVGCGCRYWLSLAAFVLAMLSKGSVAVLPLALLLIVWWQRGRITRRDVVRVVPFFVVAAGLTAVNVWFQTHGADVVVRDVSFGQRVAGAGAAVWFYLSKALLPIHLVFIYPQWGISTSDVRWWLPVLVAVSVTVLLWRRRNSLQTHWIRSLIFAWIFFCVALSPVLGFFDVGFMRFSLVADHYQHIAIIAVVALAAAGWTLWHRRTQRLEITSNVVLVAAICSLMVLSFRQSRQYADAATLYQATLRKNPDCWVAHNNLGEALLESHLIHEAQWHFEKALRLKPDYADAHNNLGNALFKMGRSQEAIEQYQKALALRPNYPEPFGNLALTYAQMNRPAEAIVSAEKALDLARSQSNTVLAARIEDWLRTYRAHQNLPSSSPK